MSGGKKRLAEVEYEREMRLWQRRFDKEQVQIERRLRDPEYVLGTFGRSVLPESTIDDLKMPMALERMTAKKPDKRAIYRKYGVEPDKTLDERLSGA